jgi:DNA-binding response OmpR family regulator
MAARALVLVVDDDDHVRALLGMALRHAGYDVLTAPDGRAALALVGHCPPGLILLDLDMAPMDGATFARAYRRRAAAPVPIVVVSGADDGAERAAQLGAATFLPKPLHLEPLFRVVERHLRTA